MKQICQEQQSRILSPKPCPRNHEIEIQEHVVKGLLMLAVSVAVTLACTSKADQGDRARSQSTETTSKQRVVLFEIEKTPKTAFLDLVSKSTGLSDEDKQVVRNDISADVYTHCSLVKYQSKGDLFMDIDQFYPRKEMGKDSGGHTIMEGGSGTQSSYTYKDGKWVVLGWTNYD
jgi:hypothetical protein